MKQQVLLSQMSQYFRLIVDHKIIPIILVHVASQTGRFYEHAKAIFTRKTGGFALEWDFAGFTWFMFTNGEKTYVIRSTHCPRAGLSCVILEVHQQVDSQIYQNAQSWTHGCIRLPMEHLRSKDESKVVIDESDVRLMWNAPQAVPG